MVTTSISTIEGFIKNDILTAVIVVGILGLILKIFLNEKLNALKNAVSKDDLQLVKESITVEMRHLKNEMTEIKQIMTTQAQSTDNKIVDIYDKLIMMEKKSN